MIKIVGAAAERGRIVRLEFSDGTCGDYDFGPVVSRASALTRALQEDDYFARFFLELGALAWPNGLEFAPDALHRELEARGALRRTPVA